MELLVVIAVIAVLIAILLPALASARNSARSSACLSNHRQIGVAWAAYTNDYKVFPFGDPATYRPRYDWGGVNWYSTGLVPGFNLVASRPVNPYLAPDEELDYRVDVFRCPLDTGHHYYATGGSDLATLGATSLSGSPDTMYGVAGTSYAANVWMYCKPGEVMGWQSQSNATSKNTPDDVRVATSRFVIECDDGPMFWLVSTEPYRRVHNLGGEWWHGRERAAMSFLDGSARVEKTGLLVCPRYSFHMLPLDQFTANGGFHWPDLP